MRILHTSDWHLGKYLNDFSLIEDQRYILEKIGLIAKENKVDVILISGDIYHRSVPSAEAVELLDETLNLWLKTFKIPVLAIAGNHDSPERISFGSRLYEQSGLYIQGKAEKTIKKIRLKDDFGYLNFYLLPFIEPIKLRRLLDDNTIKTYQDGYKALLNLNENKIDIKERNVILAHSFFTGVMEKDVMEHSETERNVGGSDMVSSEIFSDFDYVALGHLHAPQTAGSKNIRYSGSILKYSLSEVNQKKSVYIIDINEKYSLSVDKIPLTAKRDLRILEGSMEEILQEGKKNGEKNTDYIFANLTDNIVFDGMSRLRAIYPNIIGLTFRDNYKEDSFASLDDIENKEKSMEELFGKFFFEMTDEEMSDQEKEIIEKLAKEIEGEEI